VPIILLTALGDVADRITGLQLGADDYMVKPFSPKELEARIRCVMRRASTGQGGGVGAGGSAANVVVVGDLSVDFNRRQAFRADERIRLTGMEFNLLELLISRSGEPISRLDMLEKVWGYKPERSSDSRVVDVHISRLRAKLEHDPENPELILTARGMGYMFQRIAQTVNVG
jgi:OmpR family response regulator RpaB